MNNLIKATFYIFSCVIIVFSSIFFLVLVFSEIPDFYREGKCEITGGYWHPILDVCYKGKKAKVESEKYNSSSTAYVEYTTEEPFGY